MLKCCPFTAINFILSLLVMFSLEDKIFIVQQWNSFQPLATIRRSFRRRDARYHGKNLPSLRTIRYVIDNFQKHGTVLDRRKSHFVNNGRVLSCVGRYFCVWHYWPVFLSSKWIQHFRKSAYVPGMYHMVCSTAEESGKISDSNNNAR